MWWFLIVIAALFEIGWATGLKYASDGLSWAFTIIAIIVSFGILIIASTKLPTATVYAVFVGLGTVGTVLVDILLFGTSVNIGVILFIGLLLIGIIGLKSVTDEKLEEKEVDKL